MASDNVEITIPKCAYSIPNSSDASKSLTWTFQEMIGWVVDRHPMFNQSREGSRQGDRIINSLLDVKEGEKATMRREDCKALQEVLKSPACTPRKDGSTKNDGYAPELSLSSGELFCIPSRRFTSYFDAIDAALNPN